MTKKLLVIEDDQSTVRLLTIALEREGYEIQVASNGLTGLKAACAQTPQAILLDLMLPGVDGFEVLNQLRSTPETADIPVIVISAKGSAADKERAAKLGAAKYLEKPYRMQQLRAELEMIVDNEEEPEPERSTRYVVFVGPRPSEVAGVIVHLGALLVHSVENVTTIDLHPYAVEHPLSMDMTPPATPFNLDQIEAGTPLQDHVLHHESGLTLLSNFVGSGDIGQPTLEEAQALLSFPGDGENLTLVDVPLRPPTLVKDLAKESLLIVIVSEEHPATLAATRSTVDLLREQGVEDARLGFVLLKRDGGISEGAPEIGVLATLPTNLASNHPGWQDLKGHILEKLSSRS
jgi:DNA-binding response OmpR family regulator